MSYIVEIKQANGWREDSEHAGRAAALAVARECQEDDGLPARILECVYEVREFGPDGTGGPLYEPRNSTHKNLDDARETIRRMGGCDPFQGNDDALESWCDGTEPGCGGWDIFRDTQEG